MPSVNEDLPTCSILIGFCVLIGFSEGAIPPHGVRGERGGGRARPRGCFRWQHQQTNKQPPHARPPLQICRRSPGSGNQVIAGWALAGRR